MSDLDEQMPLLWALTFECQQCGAWWNEGTHTLDDKPCSRCGCDVPFKDAKQLTLGEGKK